MCFMNVEVAEGHGFYSVAFAFMRFGRNVLRVLTTYK